MKKILSLVLLLAMLLTSLIACGGNEGKGGETTTKNKGGNNSGDPAETTPYLEDQDFDGFEYVYLHPTTSEGITYEEGELNDNSIYDRARYQRDSEIKERFNVTFKDLDANATYILSYMLQDAINTESSYSVACPRGDEGMAALVSAQAAYNVKDMPYIDLSQPWYNQQCIDEYTVMGKMYFLPGMFPGLGGASPVLFNKNIIDDIDGLEYPYELILNGEWTMEKMLEYTSAGYKDKDTTPGVSAEDRFGYTGHPGTVAYLYTGLGGLTSTKNEDGAIIPVLYDATVDAIYEKLFEFYSHQDHWIKSSWDAVENPVEVFFRGDAMFTYWTTATKNYTDIDTFEYGLAIMPKYDLDQENYMIRGGGMEIIFPVNIGDADTVGYIHEALNEASYRITYPADIQESVEFERLTDEESIEVQKLVDKSIVFDVTTKVDPTDGQVGWCGFIKSCLTEGKSPAIKVQEVGDMYEKAFRDFFY